jgi:hypothetical protein
MKNEEWPGVVGCGVRAAYQFAALASMQFYHFTFYIFHFTLPE